MSVTAIQTQQVGSLSTLDDTTMQQLISGGDCARLNAAQKTAYYVARCEAAGLDPRAQPFAFMKLNGKEVLYAQKAASDQLAAKHGVRMTIVSQATEEGIRVVTVRAEAKDGRVTEEIGALPVKGLMGEALSNALMKCVTKAKRRAVLSLCGLGMLDETEVESIPQAHAAPPPAAEEAIRVIEVKAAPTPPPPAPPKRPTPPYVSELWDEAGREWGEKGREPKWRAATHLVFHGQVPPTADWTEQQTAAVRESLFGPRDVPF